MNVIVSKAIACRDFIKIEPNQQVVIKPNLVKEAKETDPDEWESVINSLSLIKHFS